MNPAYVRRSESMAFPVDLDQFTESTKLFQSLQTIHLTLAFNSEQIPQHATAGPGFELRLHQTRRIIPISNFFLVSFHHPSQRDFTMSEVSGLHYSLKILFNRFTFSNSPGPLSISLRAFAYSDSPHPGIPAPFFASLQCRVFSLNRNRYFSIKKCRICQSVDEGTRWVESGEACKKRKEPQKMVRCEVNFTSCFRTNVP